MVSLLWMSPLGKDHAWSLRFCARCFAFFAAVVRFPRLFLPGIPDLLVMFFDMILNLSVWALSKVENLDRSATNVGVPPDVCAVEYIEVYNIYLIDQEANKEFGRATIAIARNPRGKQQKALIFHTLAQHAGFLHDWRSRVQTSSRKMKAFCP